MVVGRFASEEESIGNRLGQRFDIGWGGANRDIAVGAARERVIMPISALNPQRLAHLLTKEVVKDTHCPGRYFCFRPAFNLAPFVPTDQQLKHWQVVRLPEVHRHRGMIVNGVA
jgi:hypothetical protein